MRSYTLKGSANWGKYIENQLTKLSFKLTSDIFPESHRVALFIVFKFHPNLSSLPCSELINSLQKNETLMPISELD